MRRLLALRDALAAEPSPIPLEVSGPFLKAFDRWRADPSLTLDEAFGLKPCPGQNRPQLDLAREQRNALIREAAERFVPAGASRWQTGRILSAELRRYHGTAWQRERTAARPPAAEDTLRFFLWQILRAVPATLSTNAIAVT